MRFRFLSATIKSLYTKYVAESLLWILRAASVRSFTLENIDSITFVDLILGQ